jgi:hypothetical protein
MKAEELPSMRKAADVIVPVLAIAAVICTVVSTSLSAVATGDAVEGRQLSGRCTSWRG